MVGFVNASELLVLPLEEKALRDILEQLRRTPTGLDNVLARTVQYGVAYHHAGKEEFYFLYTGLKSVRTMWKEHSPVMHIFH